MALSKISRFASAILSPLIVMAVFSCSQDVKTYDELRDEGVIEKTVRKKYSRFFSEVSRLSEYTSGSNTPDSVLISDVSKMADEVMADFRDFPVTLDSRLAFDAFSYAAHDLTVSDGFSHDTVSMFWERGLIDPLIFKGWQYVKEEEPNESTHMQLVRSLRRAIYDRATNDIITELIPIVGPAPSSNVMAYCYSDSLVFRKIHDMLVYTRSLQKIGPPIWMITGPWLMCLDIEGFPLIFVGLETVVVDQSLYLLFRTYDQATVYSIVYEDPVPEDSGKTDSWLARAGAVMSSLEVDNEFIDRVSKVEFPLYDMHYFYDDYLTKANYDSTTVEYSLSFKRNRVENGAFSFIGADSLSVVFDQSLITQFKEPVAVVPAKRTRGASMNNGMYIEAKTGEGEAYLMPFGVHDDTALRELQEQAIPEITVDTGN